MNELSTNTLTEVAGEGGPDLAPQKFYCPNSLFTILGPNPKWPPEVQKGLQLLKVHKSEDEFFVYICDNKSTNSYISGTKHGRQILYLMRCLNCWDNKNF